MSRTRGKREAGGRRSGDLYEEEKHSSGGWSGGKKALAAVLCLLAVLVLAGAGWWFLFVRAPDVKDNDRPLVNNNNPNRKPEEDGDGEQVLTGRKEDYFTFLLIGRDTAGGGNTDTLILVSYDVPNSHVNMMSIPRDTVVNVPWSVKKVNSVFNAKESSGGGMEGLKKQVAYLTGVMPDFHVIIEWKAVGEIVKAVGGVDFDVPRNMNYDDDYQNLHIHLNKGMQHLNAEQAMAMLRYRNDNGYKAGYNDTGRMNTQRDFLKAMAKEVLQLKNMTKIGEFINIFMDNVETDLKVSELTWFASKALSVDLETMQSSTLPYIDVGKYRGGDYLFPNGEEIVPLVNEQFNPYNQEITADSLQIMVRSKDGSCYVTNGELLDAKWAKPASGSAGTTGGGVTTTEPPALRLLTRRIRGQRLLTRRTREPHPLTRRTREPRLLTRRTREPRPLTRQTREPHPLTRQTREPRPPTRRTREPRLPTRQTREPRLPTRQTREPRRLTRQTPRPLLPRRTRQRRSPLPRRTRSRRRTRAALWFN